MRIIMDEALKAYMNAHGKKDIVVDTVPKALCGWNYQKVAGRFAVVSDAYTDDAYDIFETECGRLILSRASVQYGDTIRLSLGSTTYQKESVLVDGVRIA